MNKLIIPDIQPDLLNLEPYNQRVKEITLQLEAEHPNWVRLDEELLLDVMNNTSAHAGKTFIVPEVLVSSRRHMTKINRLVTYMFCTARKLQWSFVVIVPSLKAIDLRIRNLIDEVEDLG